MSCEQKNGEAGGAAAQTSSPVSPQQTHAMPGWTTLDRKLTCKPAHQGLVRLVGGSVAGKVKYAQPLGAEQALPSLGVEVALQACASEEQAECSVT